MKVMIKFNDKLKRKSKGQKAFLFAQTSVKRHENKNKKQESTYKKYKKITENNSLSQFKISPRPLMLQ